MTELLNKKIDKELDILDFQDQFKPPDETEGDDQNKYSLRAWWSVIQANSFRPYRERAALYERALKWIPQCYKIWYNYLKDSLDTFDKVSPLSKKFREINELFERSLEHMQRMPKIWFMYSEFLARQKHITKIRNLFDKSLKHLPITQHEDMWVVYTDWALEQNCVATFQHIASRYQLIDQDFKEDQAEYLISRNDYNQAAQIYYELISDPGYAPKKISSKFQIYLDLCDIIYDHADEINTINCEEVMREGLKKYVDEVGNLWNKLASYYIKIGQFDKARDVYQEGIQTILTARDFNIIYNAYLKFEQEMVNALAMGNDENEDVNEEEVLEQIDRLENLVNEREMLLIDCKLRGNKNSVSDWIIKINLTMEFADLQEVLTVFTEAFNSIEPMDAENGSLAEVYIKFAMLYFDQGNFKETNNIFDRASKSQFKSVEDLIQLWTFWIELLLKEGFYKDTILVVKQALFSKRNRSEFNLFNNLTIWQLYLDLEHNFGTVASIKAAYAKMLDLKVITPFILMNYATFLEQNHYYEESFKIYETGIEMFNWPGLYEIWIIYVNKFIERYGNQKLERTRDLFEKVISQVPAAKSHVFYLMYADFEEKFGLLNHAFEVYDRMVVNVDESQKLNAYNLYIAKISHYLGITKSRPIFESAIENFSGKELVSIGLRFSFLERKFGEIDRARAIYTHISQFADPRDDDSQLWKIWNDFELHHGNVDTMNDFIRIKKSVLAKYKLMPPDINKIKAKVDAGLV